MTYDAFENSVEGGRPVELYKFTQGVTVTRYTSAEDDVVFGANTYLSRQIQRGGLAQTTDEKTSDLEITLPSDDPIASQFIGIVPADKLLLEVTRFHRGDTQAIVIWQGRITGASFKENGHKAVLRGLTQESAVARPVPRFKYQGLCNYVLYDQDCQIARSSFQFNGTVTAVSGSTITVPGLFAAHGAGWAVGGFVIAGTDKRMVISQSGDILTFRLPFQQEVLNSSVTVHAGCDHTAAVCDSKFSNILNFGGFSYVPGINPFQRGLG